MDERHSSGDKMTEPEMRATKLEEGGFLVLLLIVTLATFWLILPYFGALLWALVAAILFEPTSKRLAARMGGRENLASALVLFMLIALILIPAMLIAASLVQEAGRLYELIRDGKIDFDQIYANTRHALPERFDKYLTSTGVTDFAALRRMLGSAVANGLQSIASRALLVGQSALRFIAALGVMLYVTFFLLRDGEKYGALFKAALPLPADMRDALLDHFVIVVRATMKGTVVVAVLQGLVGGIIFWALGIEGALLWGVLMGFFSLLPAVGTGIVWVPMAAYLLLSGQYWQGAVMVFCGLFVIGLIDNLLRPILVGRDTRLPDFVVLIATLAGLELFGLNGFIVGPVIVALFLAVWRLLAERRGAFASTPSSDAVSPS